jgi:hypothetical protein
MNCAWSHVVAADTLDGKTAAGTMETSNAKMRESDANLIREVIDTSIPYMKRVR